MAVIGGGPGGLYFAALAKQLDPSRDITVWERNAPDDTFGFGVVFSDETLGGIEHADRRVYEAMAAEVAQWDDIELGYQGGVTVSGGHGFAAMSRVRLLNILQKRCRSLGVELRFRAEVGDAGAPGVDELRATHDMVVAADGVNSTVRTKFADTFRPSYDVRSCRYAWFGTDKVFDAFTFDIRDTPWRVIQVHAYPYDAHGSTLIVEMHDDVWRRAGLATDDPLTRCSEIFADLLGEHRLISNRSQWISFTTVRCETWRHDNVVLLGDAAHTAHFSIGSGTKLAMEDALALAACLSEEPSLSGALAAYEDERKPVVVSTQRAALASLEWFENLGQYTHQHPLRFAFNILTRSRRVTYDNLRLRDPEFVARVDEWFGTPPRPPMFHPFRLRSLSLKNRVVVSPMDMYSADDGMP